MARPAPTRSLLFGVLLLAGVAGSGAAQTITVRVGGEASSLVGVPLAMPLEVDLRNQPDVKLGSFSLVIRWNPAVLRLDRGENGTFGDIFANEDSLPLGVARLVGANPAGVGGNVVLGVAHFTPLVDAVDTLRLSVSELYAAGTFADLLPSATWSDRAYCTARGRFGDLNSNQAFNGQDALLVLSHAVGIDISAQGLPLLGDVDGDGVTGARDALIILSAAVGLDVSPFRVQRIAAGPCGDARRPTFLVTPAQVTMDLGQAARLIAVARDSLGTGLVATDVSWTSSDPLVAEVGATGVVTALASGTATITATRRGATSASATVAVSDRRTHWVDAFAFAADSDQIGAPELPFRTIAQALSYAQGGDTVMVRPGRYEEYAYVGKPVVIMGDTSGGRARPLIAATGAFSTGILVETGGRVELHRLRLDTLYQAVHARYVDTLLVRDVLFRSPQADAYYGSLYVDSAEVVLVQRSEFFGSGVNDYYYYYDSGVWVDWARVVSLDSVLVSDYGYNGGVYLYTVDSLFVRGSVIRQNYGYGISCNYCYAGAGAGVAAVLTGNRFVQNNYGHVYFNGIRQARFDHNVLVGGGYDAISLYGDTLRTLVTLLGDSITTRQGGWINLSNFDSLGVDSVVVREREYGYPDIRGGRIAAVTNTKFLELEGYGINISASPRDSSRLVLRNVQFHGDSAGSRSSAYAVVAYQTSVDADGVALSWLNELFYVNYGDLTLRNVTARQFYRLAYLYSHPSYRCGSAVVSNVTASRGQYALYASGCAGDSLVVDNSTFRQVRNYGVVSDIVSGRITNSLFEYVGNAIESDCGSLRVADVTVRYGDYGLDAYGCASTDSLIVKRSRFERFDVYGVYASSIHALIDTSTFADNYDNVEHYYGSLLARDNQIHRPRGDGLNAFRPATAVLERNSVACDLTRSAGGRAIYLYGSAPDSLAITGNAAAGCSNGIVVDGSPVQALVRGNTVTLPDTALYGIWVEASTAAGGLARVAGNSVSGPAKYGSIRVDYAWRAEVDTNSVDRSIQAGIYAFDVDSLFIRDNVLTNHAAGTCCIYQNAAGILLSYGGTYSLRHELLRNRITDTRASGIALVRTSSTDTVTVLVDSNTVKRADSVGIWVRYYHRAYLRKNAIDSARLDAVQLNQYSGVPPAMAHRNNFSNSGRYGVYNTLTSVTINADTNYWNGPNGPRGAFGNPDAAGTAADSVSQYVSWADYLTDAEPTLVPAPALVAAASFMTPALMVAPAASLAAPSAADATTVWIEPAGGERPIPVFHAPPRPRAASPADGRPLPPHVLEASQRQVDELEARLAERQRRLEARAAMRAEQEARERERERRRADERAAVEQARASGRQPQ